MSVLMTMPVVGGVHDGLRVKCDPERGPVRLIADYAQNYVQPNDLTALRQAYTEPVAYEITVVDTRHGPLRFLRPRGHTIEDALARLVNGYMVVVPEGQGKTIHTSKREAMGKK